VFRSFVDHVPAAAQAASTARVAAMERQVDAPVAVARALAEAGHGEQALVAARSIPDPGRPADALVAVAQALAENGQSRHARRAIVAAFGRGRWDAIVGAALQLDRSLCRRPQRLRIRVRPRPGGQARGGQQVLRRTDHSSAP
jgi:hypothetical protein